MGFMVGSLALSGSDGSSLSLAFLLAVGDEGSSLALRLPSGAQTVSQSIAQGRIIALCEEAAILLSSFTIVKASGADAVCRECASWFATRLQGESHADT